jgi:hypothetical protein
MSKEKEMYSVFCPRNVIDVVVGMRTVYSDHRCINEGVRRREEKKSDLVWSVCRAFKMAERVLGARVPRYLKSQMRCQRGGTQERKKLTLFDPRVEYSK